MPYIKIWIHLVFGTKNREQFLSSDVREKVLNHILENARSKRIFIDCIGGYTEHIHCLLSLGAEENIAKVVNLIKGECSHWINKKNLTKTKFEWADEYFAASIGESQLESVRKYIRNQEEHHTKKSYTEEYNEFMNKYGFKYLD